MRRILFVDDEPRVLEGLRGRLRRNRDRWEMVFAVGGKSALAELEAAPFDVIVTDIRMPGIDGATLLRHVQRHYPNVVRFALSGYAEFETSLGTLPVVQQFLSKPCDGQTLENSIERACQLQTLLRDEAIRSAVGSLHKLASAPRIYLALLKVLADPDVSLNTVAAVIEQDPAVSARVLQIVNSAFFGLPQRMTSLADAVVYLGVDTIKNLTFSVELSRTFGIQRALDGFSVDALQRHSYLTAKIAARLVEEPQLSKNAFTAALLHDVGKLVLASQLPELFSRAIQIAGEGRQPLHEVEAQLKGFTHAEVGAYLLGVWGLPYPIVEAVAHHHAPARVKQREFDVLAAVYVANHLAHEYEPWARPKAAGAPQPVDPAYLQALRVGDELAKWRAVAAAQARAMGAET